MASYSLPMRIRRITEAFAVEDAQETNLAYVYFEEDPKRTSIARRRARLSATAMTSPIKFVNLLE
jgi:hypothetical protein